MSDQSVINHIAQVTALLDPVRRYGFPADLVVKCIAIDAFQAGDVQMPPAGMVQLPVVGGVDGVAAVLSGAGINLLPSLDADYEGDVLLWPEPRRPGVPVQVWPMLGAAPWYVRLLVEAEGIGANVAQCIQAAIGEQEASGRGRVFRGEDGLYPEVASGIARKYQTSDPAVISSISERGLAHARGFVGRDRDSSDLRADIQHLGGLTNKVDFSKNIWVAMYFASGGNAEQDGRVWALDAAKAERTGIRIDQEPSSAAMSAARMNNQSGVLAESRSGVIPRDVLQEVVRIPGSAKALIRSLVERMGITQNVLFPDILAHMDDESTENTVSVEELVRMWLGALQRGQSRRVIDESARLLETVDPKAPDVAKIVCGSYCGSLAAAIAGDIWRARHLMQQAVGALPERAGLPPALRKNRSIIRKGGSRRRMKASLRLDPFEELWRIMSAPYRIKSVPSIKDASEVWRRQESTRADTGPGGKPGWVSTRETVQLSVTAGTVKLHEIRPGAPGIPNE